jgi:homopolymeric O-antigen transport system permease protein
VTTLSHKNWMGPLGLSRFGYIQELVLHLARRELNTRHRWTLLGWAWPLARVLAQLGVLVVVFSSFLDLNIENYPVFVFSGIIAFTWFSSGISDATSCLLAQRHLVVQPGFPTPVVPVVSVAVPFVDVLMALPVLILMLALSGDLSPVALVFLPLLVIQLVLMCGLGWLASALTVYLRDVPNVVLVGLTLLFYVTPVFYSVGRVPEQYRWILQLNPLGTLIESYRWALLGDPFPGTLQFCLSVAASFLVAVLGLLAFRRLRPGFVDEL